MASDRAWVFVVGAIATSTSCFHTGGPGASSERVTDSTDDGYTSYTPGGGVRVTSGEGDTYTVRCRGSNEACFDEAQQRCPHGYETIHGPSPVAVTKGFSGFTDDDDDALSPFGHDDDSPAEFNEMRVKCKLPRDSEAIAASIREKEAEDRANRAPAQGESPQGAAGFTFGQSLGETRETCEAAGHTMNDQTCSGTAEDVGVEAATHLGFCNGELCMVVVESAPPLDEGSRWRSEFLTIRKALETKYGPASNKKVRWPAGCQEASEFLPCLQSATAYFRYEWSWGFGHGLVLALGRRDGKPSLRITYSSPSVRDARAPAGL